ncbi:hypothetical protein N5T11_10465, partial [Aliarcobacter cryaerophilus]|nr:hypothetical protein [Aliarcobacter cryaerophilus]
KRRMFEYGKADYSYSDSLQQVSYEMKHNRASITEHYLEDDFYFLKKIFYFVKILTYDFTNKIYNLF